MKTGGCTSVCQTLTSCPGQCCHPFLTTALVVSHYQQKAPREPAREGKGGNPKSASEQSQGGAPRELPHAMQDTLPPQALRISEILPEMIMQPTRLPGRSRLKVMDLKPRGKRGNSVAAHEVSKAPAGDWSGLPGYLGAPRATSVGRRGPRNPAREGMPLTHQRDRSMGKRGPRIRPRDDDVGGHPAEFFPGSRQRMSRHAVGWFLRNMERAFATMDDGQLNHVSETLNNEMDMRGGGESELDPPRGARSQSRAGRERSRPPAGGEQTE